MQRIFQKFMENSYFENTMEVQKTFGTKMNVFFSAILLEPFEVTTYL